MNLDFFIGGVVGVLLMSVLTRLRDGSASETAPSSPESSPDRYTQAAQCGHCGHYRTGSPLADSDGVTGTNYACRILRFCPACGKDADWRRRRLRVRANLLGNWKILEDVTDK